MLRNALRVHITALATARSATALAAARSAAARSVTARSATALAVALSAALSVTALVAGFAAPAGAVVAHPASVRAGAAAGMAISPGGQARWTGTWEAAPSGVDTGFACTDCTIRNIVHTSVAGDEVQIRLSNVFGAAALQVAQATVALPAAPGSAATAAGTLHEVTFGGVAAVTIPAGQSVLSDPVALAVPANHDLLVTTYTPGDPTPFTYHPDAQEYSFYTSGADAADATSAAAFPETTGSWYLLTGVQVTGPGPGGPGARGDVVAFGDSITDGYQSSYDLNARWPNILADRLLALPARDQLGVLNAGIGGNRILLDGGNGFGPAAISRFQRDVLDQPAVRTVIILEGINDIQQTPHQLDAQAIIAGLRQLIGMAHARGVRVIGGTLTPFEGWSTYGPQEEQTREAVNQWIRTSHAYDGVIDFDAVVRDPADPHRILPAFDSGDHLHPNDAGYRAMGAAIPLTELGTTVPPGSAGPAVRSIAPDPARAGQVVTIRGSGFGATQDGGYVAFSDAGASWGAPGATAALTIDSWSDRAIAFTVPTTAGIGGTGHVSPGTTATVTVASAAGSISRTAPLGITPTANLADYADDTGTSPDTDQGCANLDGDGFSYSAQTLAAAGLLPGATVSLAGLSYTWPSATACRPDNVVAGAQTVLMPGTRGDTTLGLLGSSTSGTAQGTVLIHYRDGSTSAEPVSIGDWAGSAVSGDTTVATLPYRNSQSGTSDQLTVRVFAATVPVDPARTVTSVTLPDIGYTVAPSVPALHIFSLALGS